MTFQPHPISLYSLVVTPGTPLYQTIHEGKCSKPPDQMAEIEMYKFGTKFLEKQDYKQYTITDFARENKEYLY